MRRNRLTSVVRLLDPRYPTNLAILAVTAAVAFGGMLYRLSTGSALRPSLVWGAVASLTVLFTWVLGRELDPDHDLAAFVGVGLILVSLPFLPALARVAALIWLILLMRLLNRVVGPPATLLDSLGILGLSAWLSLDGNWGFGLLAALALYLDSQLQPPHRPHLAFAGAALLGTAAMFAWGGDLAGSGRPSPLLLWALIGLVAMTGVVIFTTRRVGSHSDATDEPLRIPRVRAAQTLALLAGLQSAIWGGDAGLLAFSPLWAATLGIALNRLYLRIMAAHPEDYAN